MNFKIVKPEINQLELLEHIGNQFPAIKEDLFDEDYEGLIHIQVGLLANYTNDCIGTARFDEVGRIFQFFDTVISKVDSKTENALYVSFLEHINMDGETEKERSALKLLPSKFLTEYKQLRNFS